MFRHPSAPQQPHCDTQCHHGQCTEEPLRQVQVHGCVAAGQGTHTQVGDQHPGDGHRGPVEGSPLFVCLACFGGKQQENQREPHSQMEGTLLQRRKGLRERRPQVEDGKSQRTEKDQPVPERLQSGAIALDTGVLGEIMFVERGKILFHLLDVDLTYVLVSAAVLNGRATRLSGASVVRCHRPRPCPGPGCPRPSTVSSCSFEWNPPYTPCGQLRTRTDGRRTCHRPSEDPQT